MILEKWKNAQTYVIGKYHINNNMPCQDRTAYLQKNGVKVIVLADGAGSQSNSHIGAEIVCNKICNLMVNNFVEYLMYFEYQKVDPSLHKEKMNELSKLILSEVLVDLKNKALAMNVSIKELSSTLLFFATKDHHYIQGHIGDGVIAGLYVENQHNRIKIFSEPENGTQSNITFFVTDTDSVDHLRLKAGKNDNIAGVIMSSDGAADVLFKKNIVDPSVYELFSKFSSKTSEEYNQILSEFLTKVISNYSTDDLSFNLLFLEDIDTDVVDKNYAYYMMRDIVSSKQVIKKSQYCYYLDSAINPNKVEFNSPDDVKRYIKWN